MVIKSCIFCNLVHLMSPWGSSSSRIKDGVANHINYPAHLALGIFDAISETVNTQLLRNLEIPFCETTLWWRLWWPLCDFQDMEIAKNAIKKAVVRPLNQKLPHYYSEKWILSILGPMLTLHWSWRRMLGRKNSAFVLRTLFTQGSGQRQ